MARNKEGLQTVIKRLAHGALWTHSLIHCESLAAKELSEMMGTVIKFVAYTKTRPLESRLFFFLQNYAKKWGRGISHSCFTEILIGCQEETLWLMFTTCEKKKHCF
jgi:hypothetical protein